MNRMVEVTLEQTKPIEVSGQVNLYELMDNNLTEDNLLDYLKDRKIEVHLSDLIVEDIREVRRKLQNPVSSSVLKKGTDGVTRLEELIQEVAKWPEFIPTLILMHYHGDIDIKALNQEILRTEGK